MGSVLKPERLSRGKGASCSAAGWREGFGRGLLPLHASALMRPLSGHILLASTRVARVSMMIIIMYATKTDSKMRAPCLRIYIYILYPYIYCIREENIDYYERRVLPYII